MGARYEMRAVELVEVEADPAATVGLDPADGQPDAHRPTSPRPRGSRSRPGLRRALIAGMVAVVAVGVGGTTLVAGHRERERLAGLADLPGILRPLAGPVTEQWRTDVPLWVDLHPVAGLLVGVTDTRDESRDVDVIAVDAATGETAWTAQVVRGPRAPLRGVRCVVPDAAPGAGETDRVVACLVVDELGPSSRDLSRYEPTRSRLLVLEATTGTVVEERVVDPSTSVASIGPDLVVMERARDGGVRVARTDIAGTQERWTFAGPPDDRRREYTSVQVDDGLVVVPGESGWLLSGDGEVVEAWTRERPASAAWAEVVQGRTLVRPLRDAVGATAVTDLATGEEFTVDGYPITEATDDGSAGDLLLVQSSAGEGLQAYEPSGDRRWTVEGPDSSGLVVLDGRVIHVDDERMQAVDAGTGRTVWETPVPSASQNGLLTDGRVVLRAERAGDDVVVAARGVDDGRVRWQGTVPDDVQHLFVVAGRLYGYTADGLVALRESGT